MDELSGTKELIFDTFVEMISTFGYENVSIRDITNKVGIKPASMYNHFKSKEKLLKYAYEYHARHQYDTRKSVDVMKKLIETASAEEIITAFAYSLVTEDQKKYSRMILITKIIYMRLFQDPVANAMFAENDANNAEYVINVLKHGVDVGRLDPEFDLETFASVLIGSMQNMGIKAFASITYELGELEHKKRILAMQARLLSSALK
ncbi:MAG: TetR/AcrR family transcriptional regulator [Synergistaceae bacterium]|nr:TetR/AcrR family transcriptional regulator [Synergistaceae bacterium]